MNFAAFLTMVLAQVVGGLIESLITRITSLAVNQIKKLREKTADEIES